MQASFQEAVKKSAVPAQALGDNVDVKKLPGIEALFVDGAHYATLISSRSALSGCLLHTAQAQCCYTCEN